MALPKSKVAVKMVSVEVAKQFYYSFWLSSWLAWLTIWQRQCKRFLPLLVRAILALVESKRTFASQNVMVELFSSTSFSVFWVANCLKYGDSLLIYQETHPVSHKKCLRLKFTNLICYSTDETFSTVLECRIKAVSRNVQYITLKVKLHQLPISNLTARMQFMKKFNGYKPFLYGFTWKCDFIQKLNAVSRMFWSVIKTISNVNHSCPFVTDFEIPRFENIVLENLLINLPLPFGDYALFSNYSFYDKLRVVVNLFATVY